MGAPVNTGIAGRFGNWCASWSPANIVRSYDADNRKYLHEVNPSGDFIRLIEQLADALPNVTTSQVTSMSGIGWVAGWAVSGKEQEIQRGIFLHVAAHWVHLYLKDKKNLSQEEVLSALVVGLTNTIRNVTLNPVIGTSKYYTFASEMLPPVLRNIHVLVKIIANALKDIHNTSNVSLDYDKNDKLVASVQLLNSKIIDWMRKEVALFPVESVTPEYQPIFKSLAPLFANDPSFEFIWMNLKVRLPALVSMTLVHLRTLLSVRDDADLVEKLKADFKEIYCAAGPLNEASAKALATSLLNRYLKPVFISDHIPEFMRAFVITKLTEILSAKLVTHRAQIDEFLSDRVHAPKAPALAPAAVPAPPGADRVPTWYDRYLPEAFAASYRKADEAYLNQLNPNFLDLINDLNLKLPVFSKLNDLLGTNAGVIQQAIIIHFIANLCKTIYKENKGPFELDRIVCDITVYFHKYLIDTLQLEPPVTEKSFYEPTKAFLVGISPEIGDIPYIIEFAAKGVHEIYLSKEMPAIHDKNDKLVETAAKLTHKILAYTKKEVKALPNNGLIKEPFKTLAKILLPVVAEDASFKGVWDHIEARIPSLLQLLLNHLRALLRPENDEDLIVKLKADFKIQWLAVPNDFPRLSENLINRYLSPIFDSLFIPALFKPMMKKKLTAFLAAKLQENIVKIEDALGIRPAPPALPVHVVAPIEPSIFDKYTPEAIARSYKDENEQYLKDLIGSDRLVKLVKNLSHKIDLSEYAPAFLKTMINGNAIELQEGVFIHLVVSLCKTLYDGKEKPASETQVIQDIVSHLSKSIKSTFDKADMTRDLKVEDFNESADQLIKNLFPELGEIPYAINPVANLLYEFYLFSRITPIVPVQDPLNATAANYKEKLIESVREQAADVKKSETLNEIDPALGNIADQLIKTFSQDPIFNGIWMFVEKQIPSLMQTELVYLKNLLNAKTNRELFIKFGLDFSRIWKENRQDPAALTNAILSRYFMHMIDSHLIPATLKPFILPMIQEKLKDILFNNQREFKNKAIIKNQAIIDAAIAAFDLEKDLLLNDPLGHYSAEARQVVSALTKRFYPNVEKKLPKEVSKELGESIMEEALYHVFGRLQRKFGANNFKELQSHIIAYTHQKLSVLVRSAEIDDTIYLRMTTELLDELAPGVNACPFIEKSLLVEYLKTIVEIVHIREPKDLGFGQLDKEMKPFLNSIVDFILKKAVEKPLEIIPELVLNPNDLKNPETLALARAALYKHLANGFAQFFGNGKLHQGLGTLLGLFSQYGSDKARISEYFANWVKGFDFDAEKAASISEEAGSKAFNSLLKKVHPSKQSYLNDLLNRFSKGDVEKKRLLSRHLLLNLNLERALNDLSPKLDELEKMDKEMGAVLMTSLLPTLSREKYPDLFDNVTDIFAPSLLRMLGTIPEKLKLHSELDLKSLAHPEIHPAATILSKLSALTDAISESAIESDFAIGKKLAAFFVEIGASHMIVNNDNNIDLLIVWLAERNFMAYDDVKLKKYAKKLIKAFCPVLEAFSPSSEEMVVKLLQTAKAKIPSNDRKDSKAAIRAILFDPNNRTDHHNYDVDRYIEQIDKAVFAFAGLILKWTRAYGEKNLPDSLKQLVKVEGPLLQHSQEVIAALLMKAVLNFIRKVEEINPGPKGTLLGRAIYVLINTIVTNLPDIKEGNFKDLSEALWKLFDLDKEVSFDLSFVRKEFLPKQLMEYSQSMRKYIDEMPKNSKELKELFNNNALPELLRVLGTVWIKDFIPHFLSENTEELSSVLLTEINGFFDATVLQEGDSSFIADTIRELLKKREDNGMVNAYAFAGLYASAYMLKFFNNLFKKKKIDGLAQEVARGAVSKLSTYYSKVVEVKGRRPHAHLLSPEELKDGLGDLFSNGMPINGEELSDSQKAFYGKLTKALEKAGDADQPDSVPMIDFLQEPFHNLITDKLLPSTLSAIIKTIGSRKTINKGLLKLIETVTEKLSSDWDILENTYHNTLCNVDDLNYRLNGIKEVGELKELVKEVKTKYGADPDQVMAILKFVDAAVKNEDGSTIDKVKNDIQTMIEPLKKLAENQDEDLVDDLSKLRDAIIHLVPKKFVADLIKIEAFNEMTSSQLGVLFNRLVNGLKFEDWINLGSEVLMPALIPNGVYNAEKGHFGPIKPDDTLAADLKDVPYTEAEARADERRIVDGFAEVSIDGTNKAIIHGIKSYIRDLSMKIGQKLIKWFGVRIIPLRKAYTAIVEMISFILTPCFYVISHLSAPVIKFVERKVARREIEPHIRGFHADYNQNVILLLMEDLVTLLTNGKADDKENLQNSNARV